MANSESLKFEGFSVELVRSRRKTLTLEIGVDGVKARAPMRMSRRSIEQFVQKKNAWILKHLQNKPSRPKPLKLSNGISIYYQGEPFTLNVLEGKRGSGSLVDDRIILPVSRSHLAFNESIQRKLVKFYKQAALDKLQQRISFYAQLMNVPKTKQTGVKVRDYKRRWGSCDHLGRLSFNWRIIQAPPAVLDYVVVHELAHCHEFNHSRRFWSIVEQQLPDWKDRQNWLQEHGAQLYRF